MAKKSSAQKSTGGGGGWMAYLCQAATVVPHVKKLLPSLESQSINVV